TVILSGWARRANGTSEAELMRSAWTSPGAVLVSDRTARTTAGNAANVTAVAEAIGASELVVVTSRWHRPRARILFRARLRGRPGGLKRETAPAPRPPAVVARELVCLAFAPFQLVRVRRAVRSAVRERRSEQPIRLARHEEPVPGAVTTGDATRP